jgi:hypothetical protein
MVGGMLDATWKKGDISAHFVAHADMLICWEPNHYQAEIGVRIDARATIHFFGTHHVSLHADALLRIWGPEFGGHAHVQVKVIGISFSFDLDLGNQSRQLRAISWETFQESFIPNEPITFLVERGLERQMDFADGLKPDGPVPRQNVIASLNANDFCLSVKSAFAATRAQDDDEDCAAVGIPAVGVARGAYGSRLTVTVTEVAGGSPVNLMPWDPTERSEDVASSPKEEATAREGATLMLELLREQLPAALWGDCQPLEVNKLRMTSKPKLNDPSRIPDAISGFRLRAQPSDPAGDEGVFVLVEETHSKDPDHASAGWQDIGFFSTRLTSGPYTETTPAASATVAQRQALNVFLAAPSNDRSLRRSAAT